MGPIGSIVGPIIDGIMAPIGSIVGPIIDVIMGPIGSIMGPIGSIVGPVVDVIMAPIGSIRCSLSVVSSVPSAGSLWLCDTGTDSGLTARTNGGVVKSSLCQLLSTPERAGGAAKGGLILSTV